MTESSKEKTKFLFRRSDCILLVVLLLFSALSFLLTRFLTEPGATVTVTVDGEFFGSWSLTKEHEIAIPGTHGTNVLQITDGTAFITEAECPDLICQHHRPITHTGERIVCLPNRIIVSIDGAQVPDTPDAVSQ